MRFSGHSGTGDVRFRTIHIRMRTKKHEFYLERPTGEYFKIFGRMVWLFQDMRNVTRMKITSHDFCWLVLVCMIFFSGADGIARDDIPNPFTAEDMLSTVSFARGSEPVISPDGALVAYGAVDVADEHNIMARRPTGFLWIVSVKNGKAKLLLGKGIHGEMPAWSPDGEQLAFFQESDRGWRLAVYDRSADRVRALGESFVARNYLSPQWDKSGRRIVLAVPEESEPKDPPRIYVIKNTDKRTPNDGFFVNSQKAGLAVIDVQSGSQWAILPGPIFLRSFKVSPDGQKLIFTAPNPESFGVIRKEYNDTFVVSLNGGAPERVLPSRKGQRYIWSPDGKSLLFLERGRLQSVSLDRSQKRRSNSPI